MASHNQNCGKPRSTIGPAVVDPTSAKPSTLSKACINRLYKVVGYGENQELALRLSEMGICRGATIEVVQKVAGGMKILLNGSEIALGESVLSHIMVIEDDTSNEKVEP